MATKDRWLVNIRKENVIDKNKYVSTSGRTVEMLMCIDRYTGTFGKALPDIPSFLRFGKKSLF